MSYSNINKKTINLGIQILRVILCFWVLAFHSLNNKKINYFLFYITKTKFFHVPCFTFISFYFSYNIFFQSNCEKAKKRLVRLLIPYIIWPLIEFIKNNIPFNKNNFAFYPLKMQLLLGREFIIPLWFLFSIIILNIVFLILSISLKKNFLFFSQLLMILVYIGQYSNSYKFLNSYKNHVKDPILDTLRIFPNCVSALTFVSIDLMQYFKKYKVKSIFFSFIILFSLFKYDLFVDLGGYNGIINNFASFFFFILFYLLPLENIHIQVQNVIKQATNYTQGIYCLHTMIIPFVFKIFGKEGTLSRAIIIYILSYFISMLGYKLFGKTTLKYLFI